LKLAHKITALRKKAAMSQEELAEQLHVSRQAVSRWEMGTAIPDATNLLKISKLFNVTTDYLLNDDYNSDEDLPRIKEIRDNRSQEIMGYFVVLEIMIVLMQVMTVFVLQNVFFTILTFVPFVGMIGGFEYAHRRKARPSDKKTDHFRKRFYQISAWLGSYFPVRLLTVMVLHFYPRPYSALAMECTILSLYLAAAMLISLSLEKQDLKKEEC